MVSASALRAQQDTASVHPDTVNISTTPPSSLLSDTLTGFRSTKSPLVAVTLSLALPGAGQVYNEDYWKAPIVWGLGGYWAYAWGHQNSQYAKYREEFERSLAELPPYGDERLQRLRDFYRDDRDKFAWYIGVLYLLNVVDAYVGSHLYDFDVSPELASDPNRPGTMATIRFRF